ncbi:hypothetical protein O3M35_001698 [Rhynocoris fuscipes]|uniref:Uncharacterized protein n=1 Tax=Rhynocoris fuscipes TaxID=488301 RepID=A0AAW1CUC8_9HEMI
MGSRRKVMDSESLTRIAAIILGAVSCCIAILAIANWAVVASDNSYKAKSSYFVIRMVAIITFTLIAGISILIGVFTEDGSLLLLGLFFVAPSLVILWLDSIENRTDSEPVESIIAFISFVIQFLLMPPAALYFMYITSL